MVNLRKSFFFIFLSFIIYHLSFIIASAQRLPETILRIGILRGVSSTEISANGQCVVVDLSNGKKEPLWANTNYLTRSKGHGVLLGSYDLGSQLRLISSSQEGQLLVNGRRYRDSLLIQSGEGKLTVINELGLEGYLYGVLPGEVSPGWPSEALKAQAVVSRTYTLGSLGKHGEKGFDLSSDVSAQVYGGVENENKNTSLAVDQTRGEVLVRSGSLAAAYFHSCCGGHTEMDFNGTSGVRDRFCVRISPRFYWRDFFSSEELLSAIGEPHDRDQIFSIQVNRHHRSGRTNLLKVRTSRRAFTIQASHLRKALGANRFRSTYLTKVIRRSGGFEFQGQGWGHGVGLCQWGMRALADRGWNYKKILAFYFPSAKVEKWKD